MKITKNEKLDANKAEAIALNYLSYKSRTEKEVREKLKAKGDFDENVIDITIETLKDRGYINDMKYAEAFALSKAGSRLDGGYKIKRMLAEKGIKYDFNEDELGIDETENAVTLIKRKCASLEELDYDEKRKITSYLIRKGYSYSTIKEAFKRFENELEWD